MATTPESSSVPRKKLRAVLGYALLVASLAVAAMVFVYQAGRARSLRSLSWAYLGTPWNFPNEAGRIDGKRAFLFHGDTTRSTRAQRQRAIWERTPDSKVYFANYIRHLLAEYNSHASAVGLPKLEEEFRRGEQLDPDNAFYNYMLAAVFFDAGASLQEREEEGQDTRYELEIKDAALLRRGVTELRKADGKGEYRRYVLEMVQEQFDALPEVTRIEDSIFRIGHLAGILLPDVSLSRHLFRALPAYAEYRAKAGKADDTALLLDAWYGYARKANRDTVSLIDALVIDAIINMADKRNSAVYEVLGRPDDAERTRRVAEKLYEPHRRWQEARKSPAHVDLAEMLGTRGSLLASLLIPDVGEPVAPESLRPGRLLDYNLLEQGVTGLVTTVLLVVMVCLAVLYGVGRVRDGSDGTPVLLLPPAKLFVAIVAGGMLLPVLLYWGYTRWSEMGSHAFSVKYGWPLLVPELILLLVTMLAALTVPAGRYVSGCCRDLGIPAPAPEWRGPWRAFWIALAVSWIACLAAGMQDRPNVVTVLPFALGVLLFSCFVGYGIYKLVCGFASSAWCGVYYATVAQSLIPIYACAVIVVGAVCLPYLAREETHLLHADMFTCTHAAEGFTRIEVQAVEHLRKGLAQAFKEVER